MDKKGQLIIVGIMILVMAVIIFIATIPALRSLVMNVQGYSYLNCAGYIDPDAAGAGCSAGNQTYTGTLESDTLSCTIMDLMIPFLILGVLVGLIAKLIHGKLVEPQGAPDMMGGGY